MANSSPRKPETERTRFCSLCAASGVATPSESYNGMQLDYCSFHYWLMRGRVGPGAYSLEDYVRASGKFAFTLSLPSKVDCGRMRREYDEKRLAPMAIQVAT